MSHPAPHTHHAHSDQSGLAELLDLDAEVTHEHHREVTSWVAALIPDRPRIVDLGAGTGVGTLGLARLLPDAEVIAVDADEAMLGRIQHKARADGVGDRVRTVQVDLDQAWPAIGPADLVWAANSLHHVADPGRVLTQTYAVLRPGGLLAVSEMGSFPRFLPDEAGAALEERCHTAMAEIRTEAGMHMDEDWSARLAAAGFAIEAARHFDIVMSQPLPAAAGRYAQITFQRMRHGLEDRLSAADLAALDTAAASAPDRDDLVIRASRTVWLGRRPKGDTGKG